MKKSKLAVLLMAMIMSVSIFMTGCSGTGEYADLEDWVQNDAVGEMMMKQLNSDEMTEDGSSMDVEGNTLIMTIPMDEYVDPETETDVIEGMEEMIGESGSDFDDWITEIEELSGIEDITIKVIYLNTDNTELLVKEF